MSQPSPSASTDLATALAESYLPLARFWPNLARVSVPQVKYLGIDELTQCSQRQYRYLFSRLRGVESVPVPIRMRTASNPGAIGHGWVKRRYIVDREPGVVFVPAKLEDHPDELFKQRY